MLFSRGVQGILYLEHLKMVTGIHDLMAMPTGSLVLVACQGSPDRIETLPWWFGLVTYWSRVDLLAIIPFKWVFFLNRINHQSQIYTSHIIYLAIGWKIQHFVGHWDHHLLGPNGWAFGKWSRPQSQLDNLGILTQPPKQTSSVVPKLAPPLFISTYGVKSPCHSKK